MENAATGHKRSAGVYLYQVDNGTMDKFKSFKAAHQEMVVHFEGDIRRKIQDKEQAASLERVEVRNGESLFLCREHLAKVATAEKVVAGDLHGSLPKLLQHLIGCGYISVNANKGVDKIDIYNKLVKELEAATNSTQVYEILDSYSKNNEITVTPRQDFNLELIGDEVCDRNPNDTVKLAILNYLANKSVKFSILYSNHFAEKLKELLYSTVGYDQFNTSTIGEDGQPNHEKALDNINMLIKLIEKGHYKLFDYDAERHIFISHAPITGQQFKNLCFKFGFNRSSLSFAEKIEKLNEHLKNKLAFILDAKKYILRHKDNGNNQNLDNANNRLKNSSIIEDLEEIVWKRKFEWRSGDKSIAKLFPDDVKIHYSGHDEYDATKYNISLDNQNYKDGRPHEENILLFNKITTQA